MKGYLKISFLLLLGICLGESLPPRPPCKGVPDKVHVKNPTGCERFYYCHDEIAVPGVCPPDYFFNLRTGICNNKNEVYCESQLCEGVANYTFFANPKSCQAYFVCLNEEASEGYCTDDHQIDVPLQRCNLKEVVKCVEPQEVDKVCIGVPDGVNVEDPEDCQKYIVCNNEKGKPGKCPAGQLFNKKTGKCDDKNNVECDTADPKICDGVADGGFVPHPKECELFYVCLKGRPTLHTCPPNYYFDPKKLVCTIDKNVCNKDEGGNDVCKGKKNGELVAHPKFCKKFYICGDGGKGDEKECMKGMLFNTKTSSCDFERNVVCNDREKSFSRLFKM